MQTNKINNVIFFKDVESNLIEEAFIILKKSVNLENFKNSTKDKKENAYNIDVLKEAEMFINQKLKQSNLQYEKFKISKLEKKIKILKIINIITIVAFIVTVIKLI